MGCFQFPFLTKISVIHPKNFIYCAKRKKSTSAGQGIPIIMNKIFKDPQLQAQFEQDGVVTFQLLSEEEVNALKEFYLGLTHAADEGFHASMFNPSDEYKQAVDQKIKEVVGNKMEDILIDYRPLYANFMVKEPGENSKMKIHQDWTYVDENQYTSVAIWLPLMDLDHHNGCLYFLKGNHKFENRFRGPGIPCPYDNLHEAIETSYSTKTPLKAGEVACWHHSVIHWSPPNISEETRIAPTMILVPKEAPVYHYFADYSGPSNKVERFEVDTDFYMNYQIGKRPEGAKLSGTFNYSFPTLEEKDLADLATGKVSHFEQVEPWQEPIVEPTQPAPPSPKPQASTQEKKGLLARIKSIFS